MSDGEKMQIKPSKKDTYEQIVDNARNSLEFYSKKRPQDVAVPVEFLKEDIKRLHDILERNAIAGKALKMADRALIENLLNEVERLKKGKESLQLAKR